MEKFINQVSMFQVSEINVSYMPKFKASERPKISSSKDAFQILFNNWDMGKISFQEQFKILLLNRANRVLGIYEVSSGGMSGTMADPKLIFAAALKSCACGIVLSHNHPSGNLTPSQADISLTKKLTSAASFLDIKIYDHLIVANEGYYSFADEGIL